MTKVSWGECTAQQAHLKKSQISTSQFNKKTDESEESDLEDKILMDEDDDAKSASVEREDMEDDCVDYMNSDEAEEVEVDEVSDRLANLGKPKAQKTKKPKKVNKKGKKD